MCLVPNETLIARMLFVKDQFVVSIVINVTLQATTLCLAYSYM